MLICSIKRTRNAPRRPDFPVFDRLNYRAEPAWGCPSKQDGNSEQLRLIRRVLRGYTAYSGRFQPPCVALFPLRGPDRREERLLALSRQELKTAVGLTSGSSNRQISQETVLAEKTVKNLVSSVLFETRHGAQDTASGACHQSAESIGRPCRRRVQVQSVPGAYR